MKVPDSGKIINVFMLLGIIIVMFIVYKLMAAVGLIKTGAKKREIKEEEAAVNMLRTDDYFSPDYYKSRKFKSLGSNTAETYAKDLRNAMAGLGTDEEAIYVTFGKLYNKCNVSEVAEKYRDQYHFPFYIMSNNLQKDLLNELTDKETTKLMNIINGLPNN